eukprot:9025406-Pyramimonas_sp.AAC.2
MLQTCAQVHRMWNQSRWPVVLRSFVEDVSSEMLAPPNALRMSQASELQGGLKSGLKCRCKS